VARCSSVMWGGRSLTACISEHDISSSSPNLWARYLWAWYLFFFPQSLSTISVSMISLLLPPISEHDISEHGISSSSPNLWAWYLWAWYLFLLPPIADTPQYESHNTDCHRSIPLSLSRGLSTKYPCNAPPIPLFMQGRRCCTGPVVWVSWAAVSGERGKEQSLIVFSLLPVSCVVLRSAAFLRCLLAYQPNTGAQLKCLKHRLPACFAWLDQCAKTKSQKSCLLN